MLIRRTGQRLLGRAFSGPLDETERDFVSPNVFYQQLKEREFEFFTGIPDSLLSDFLNYLGQNHPPNQNIVAANEGTAVAIASGYHLATKKFPVVFMQNSGIGNAVNPLLSLVDPRVYKIPMLLLMGWRGEPGKKDEPQHKVQGEVMTSMMEDLNLTFEVLPDYEEGVAAALDLALYHLKTRGTPYAFLVRRRTFLKYDYIAPRENKYPLSREEAMQIILDHIGKYDAVIAAQGFTSRELLEVRQKKGFELNQDFFCLGARGHASSVAMGVAVAKPSKTVFCFEGDGAFLTHMGAASQIGSKNLQNFKHVIFNNEVHESAGGSPSVGDVVDFAELAKGCGYKFTATATSEQEVIEGIKQLRETPGPGFLEIKVKLQTRHDLRGMVSTPKQNKEQFMKFLDL